MKLSTILAQIDAHSVEPGVWMGHCPAHDDSTPSFKVTNSDRILMHCFGGCSPDKVRKALDVEHFAAIDKDVEAIADATPREAPALGYSIGDTDDALAHSYAGGRWGVAGEDFERLGLAGDGEGLVVPFIDPVTGEPNGWQVRKADGWFSPGSFRNLGFWEGAIYPEILTVAESPGDAIALSLTGVSVVFTAGAGETGTVESYLMEHQFEYDHIILCADFDEAGDYRDSWLLHALMSDPDAPRHPSLSRLDWTQHYGMELPAVAYADDGDVSSIVETYDVETLAQIVLGARRNPDVETSKLPRVNVVKGTHIVTFPPTVEVPPIPDPELLLMTDGTGLLYPGETHSLFGEPGSGKTWLALLAIKEQIELGNRAVLIDAEDRWEKAYARLLQLGCDPVEVSEHFVYVKPVGETEVLAVEAIVRMNPTIVVIDSTGESMAIEGFEQNEDKAVAEWNQRLLIPLMNSGATVLTLDHVAKSKDNRGWAIGSQRKLAGITGAAYEVKVGAAWSRHDIGTAQIVCSKDRNGKIQREHDTATLTVAPLDDGQVKMILKPGKTRTEKKADRVSETVDRIRGDILHFLSEGGDPQPKDALMREIQGNNVLVGDVLESLVLQGEVVQKREGNAKLHSLPV